jgi:hypothetical protein
MNWPRGAPLAPRRAKGAENRQFSIPSRSSFIVPLGPKPTGVRARLSILRRTEGNPTRKNYNPRRSLVGRIFDIEIDCLERRGRAAYRRMSGYEIGVSCRMQRVSSCGGALDILPFSAQAHLPDMLVLDLGISWIEGPQGRHGRAKQAAGSLTKLRESARGNSSLASSVSLA